MTPVPTGTGNDAPARPSQPQGAPPTDASSRSVQSLSNDALEFAAKMFDLARNGSLDLVTYLQNGLPPNLTNNRGDTLLMLASYHGQHELVHRMLTLDIPNPTNDPLRFVDPNQLNAKGQSCVAGAVFKDYPEVIKILIQHGADPLAGQPNAEETARMFGKYEDEVDADGNVVKEGYGRLFENASGRGRGGREVGEAVEDREEVRRVPGRGPVGHRDAAAQAAQPPSS